MQYQPQRPPDRRPMSNANKLLIIASVAAVFVLGGLSIFLGREKPPAPPPVAVPTSTPQPGGFLTIDEAQAQITATPTAAPAMIVSPEPPTATPVPNFEMTPQPTDIPTLKKGATGDAVKSMQARLEELGYMRPESDDGQFGQGTENAVKAFQNANGLRADGAAGAQTLTKLFSDDAVRKPE